MENKGVHDRGGSVVRRVGFPETFRWGVATSAAQIEGGVAVGGRSPSIWDRFAAEPGRIADDSSPQVTCDHHGRWREDLDRLAWLGVTSYRFSVAWPRILPEGSGRPSPEGLDFYERLVDGLLERGIEPCLTLYHWDLPESLEARGGWRSRATVEAFAELTRVTARRLGDRTPWFVTLNEPWCAAMLGHHAGVHAPGERHLPTALAVGHHLLLAHGRAVEVLRAEAPRALVGLAQLVSPGYPASPSEADVLAARRFDEDVNRWFIEPPALGAYPPERLETYVREGVIDDRHPVLANPDDLTTIATPTDFLGLNYYSRTILRASIPEDRNAPRTLERREDGLTDMGWEVYPAGLREVLGRAHREWRGTRLLVTENGAAYGDAPDARGEIQDLRRVSYLEHHIQALHGALSDGVPVEGYFVWSLLDNFEWSFGFTKRFGLYWVDFDTLERRPKLSAHRYRAFLTGSDGGGTQP